MRDRLKEIAKEEGGGEGYSSGEDPQLRKFFEQVEDIRGSIETIVANTKRIEDLYSASLGSAIEEQVARGTQEAENLMFDTNKIASVVRNKLKAMKQDNAQYHLDDPENQGGVSVEGRLRASQHSALSKKFVDVMTQYQDVQTRCKNRFRQRMERQYLIVQPEATAQEVETALENNQGPIFSQQFLAANQRAEAKKALKDIQDRHAEILKLEQSLRELHQLFVDMQILVEAQGQMLNEIEKSVDRAVDYTEKGVYEMKKSVKLQKKSRKKLLILACCAIVLLLVIIIPTAVTLAR